MRKRTRGRLVTAIFAAGLVGGLALGNPSALADPEVPPPPAPIDPAAAPAPPPDPFAPPPPADPLAPPAPVVFAPPPPADPLAPPPANPFLPPPADPLAAAQPTVIPEGTPAGQNPTPYTGRAGVRAADLQPDEWLQGRSRQADLHQLRPPDRRPGRWPSRRSTSRRFRRCPAGSTGPATPRCAGGRRTSGRQAPSSTSTPAAPSRVSPFPSSWSPPSMTRRTR